MFAESEVGIAVPGPAFFPEFLQKGFLLTIWIINTDDIEYYLIVIHNLMHLLAVNHQPIIIKRFNPEQHGHLLAYFQRARERSDRSVEFAAVDEFDRE